MKSGLIGATPEGSLPEVREAGSAGKSARLSVRESAAAGVSRAPVAGVRGPVAVQARGSPRLPWRGILRRAIPFLFGGLTIYVLLPVLVRVFAAWPHVSHLKPIWMVAALLLEAASFSCTFALKRLALRTRGWFAIVTAGLTGNSLTNVMPGADATGAAVELRLLTDAGVETGDVLGGLSATGVLQIGALLLLPILDLPAVAVGVAIRPGLLHALYLGLAASLVYVVGTTILIRTDGPLAVAARFVQAAHNRLLRRRPPLRGLDRTWLHQRDLTRGALGAHWRSAVLLATGRVLLDFGCLLTAVAATGERANAALILIAYTAAMVLALLPLTPGGLGLVEGSLSGLLALAGMPYGMAALATLAYRLVSYWLPILAGPLAYLAYVLRYHPGRGRAQRSTGASVV